MKKVVKKLASVNQSFEKMIETKKGGKNIIKVVNLDKSKVTGTPKSRTGTNSPKPGPRVKN